MSQPFATDTPDEHAWRAQLHADEAWLVLGFAESVAAEPLVIDCYRLAAEQAQHRADVLTDELFRRSFPGF